MRATLATLVAATTASLAHPVRAEDEPSDEAAPTATAPPASATAEGSTADGAGKRSRRARTARSDFHVGAWRGHVDAEAEVRGGALSGRTTLRERGVLLELAAEGEAALERGRWRLALPVAISRRETPGASQRETRAEVEAGARYKAGADLRLELTGGVEVTDRPDWLDEYQPTATGLGTTDRYSHVDLRLGGSVTAIPLRHQHVRAAIELTRFDYSDDPGYDAVDAPTHLVPGDRTEVTLEAQWRHFGDGYKVGGALAFEDQHDAVNYARDAGDGRTHAGAGGPPPNPLYHEIDLEPSVGGEVELAGGDVELGADLGYAIASDRYQGYYSRRGLHPEAHVRLARGGLTASVSLDARFWRYGPDSYQSDGTAERPALESGDRREDRKLGARLAGGYRLGRHLELIGGASVVQRDTNFPDYVPGVFPASRQYDVRWDYTNWDVSLGLRARR